jgi:curved DNA-binding protein CbpA/ribosomal protein L40E/DNA-binding beta-propeller fold protein YncE
MKAHYVLGIDFGTSNLRAHRAVLRDDGQLEVPPQAAALHGAVHDALPTVLELDTAGQNVVAYGQPALNNLLASGEGARFVQEFKPCLGQAPEDVAEQGVPQVRHDVRVCARCQAACSPDSLFCRKCGARLPEETAASALFRYSQDEAFLWTQRMIERVVRDMTVRVYGEPLTMVNEWKIIAGVPVHWKDTTRAKFSSLLSGCFENENIELVTEPEAALRFHLWSQTVSEMPSEPVVLVVDFGAGTTDIVLARLSEDGRSLVESRSYGERYGGGDFDVKVATYIADCLKIPLKEELPLALKQRGKELKEQFSHAMSAGQQQSMMSVAVLIDGEFYGGIVRLDRATFESEAVAGGLVNEFEGLLSRAMTRFGTEPQDVGAVIVTGGGAWWYFVEGALRQFFPNRPVLIGAEPDKAISKGLTLTAMSVPRRGRNVTVSLELTWEEAQQGCTKTVQVEGREEMIQIQAGVVDGQEIVLKGKGCPGEHGGSAGDIIIQIRVILPSPQRGDDLQATLELTWDEAQLGCEKRVVTEIGAGIVEVPAGVKDGQTLRCKGQGKPGQFGGDAGDLLVRILVAEPETPSRNGRGAVFTLWRTLTGHTQTVKAIAFSPDGKSLASGSATKKGKADVDEVTLWDVPSGMWQMTFEGHGGAFIMIWAEQSGSVRGLAFSPDGKTLATASEDWSIKLWDVTTGKMKRRLKHSKPVRAVAFSPDGKMVASATDQEMVVKLWDAQTGALKQTLSGHLANVECVTFSPDGETLASGGVGASLILWNAETGAQKVMLTGYNGKVKGIADSVVSVAFSPDGKALASGCLTKEGGLIVAWDVQTESVRWKTPIGSAPSSVAFSPDGTMIASGGSRKEGEHDLGEVRIWDARTGTLKTILTSPSDRVESVAFSRDGQIIACGTAGGVVELWRAG